MAAGGSEGADREGWWCLSSKSHNESLSPALFSEVTDCSLKPVSLVSMHCVRGRVQVTSLL